MNKTRDKTWGNWHKALPYTKNLHISTSCMGIPDFKTITMMM